MTRIPDDELRALVGKVTTGEWTVEPPEHGYDRTWQEGDLGGIYSGEACVCSFGSDHQYYNSCGDEPNASDARLIAAAPSLAAEVLDLRAEVARLKQSSIDTWSAMNAMRNCINEHIPMPSIESDLLQGPENSIFCANVADAVVSSLTAERESADRLAGAAQWAIDDTVKGIAAVRGSTAGALSQALAAHMKMRRK